MELRIDWVHYRFRRAVKHDSANLDTSYTFLPLQLAEMWSNTSKPSTSCKQTTLAIRCMHERNEHRNIILSNLQNKIIAEMSSITTVSSQRRVDYSFAADVRWFEPSLLRRLLATLRLWHFPPGLPEVPGNLSSSAPRCALGLNAVGALIIKIGLWGLSTMTIIRYPQMVLVIFQAPILGLVKGRRISKHEGTTSGS